MQQKIQCVFDSNYLTPRFVIIFDLLKYVLSGSQKHLYNNTLCVMFGSLRKGYFLDILNNSLCRQVFHIISLSYSKCVLFVKYLAKIYKTGIVAQGFIVQISMINFLEIQSPKGDICYKRHEILKKNPILCTFVAFFWLEYQKLANITASLYFVKTWVFLY